ncbi:MAG: hypothetical protein ACI9YB_002148 [Halioglobus sp.]|jgi:hypothetical protein
MTALQHYETEYLDSTVYVVTRKDYQQKLTTLLGRNVEIVDSDSLAEYCPHLDASQLDTLMANARKSQTVSFACPAVLVRDFVHLLRLSSQNSEGAVDKTHKVFFLSYLKPQKTPQTYAEHVRFGDMKQRFPYICRSMEFAQKAWPNSLYVDSWAGSGEIALAHPNEVSEQGKLSSSSTLYWSSARSWDDIRWDQSKPTQEVWNDSIAISTLHPIEGSEIKGSREPIFDRNCSYCGGGFTKCSCSGCGIPFKGILEDNGSGIALPNKFTPVLQEKGLLTCRDGFLYSLTGSLSWAQFFSRDKPVSVEESK